MRECFNAPCPPLILEGECAQTATKQGAKLNNVKWGGIVGKQENIM
jgi:hypothetical protein